MQTSPKELIFKKMDELRLQGQYDSSAYPIIDGLIEEIATQINEGELSKEDQSEICRYYGDDFLQNTIQGMGLLKKFGYAGDFLMIDKIYTGLFDSDPFNKSWDNYFYDHAAPKAVRNRKEYFKKWLWDKSEMKSALRLLNVASGPARDLLEAYEGLESSEKLKTICVEMDEYAIQYAKEVVADYKEQISFVHKNIFKHSTKKKYDLIWSAGLFDYFDDKTFVFTLKKFRNWISEGGEIVVGNFNEDHNPSRNYMQVFGEWYLNHRTEKQLIELGIAAGFKPEQLSVRREEENVNLFLHINY